MNNSYVIVLRAVQQVRAMEKYCRELEKLLCELQSNYKYNSFFPHKYASIVTQVLKEDGILGANADEEEE